MCAQNFVIKDLWKISENILFSFFKSYNRFGYNFIYTILNNLLNFYTSIYVSIWKFKYTTHNTTNY